LKKVIGVYAGKYVKNTLISDENMLMRRCV